MDIQDLLNPAPPKISNVVVLKQSLEEAKKITEGERCKICGAFLISKPNLKRHLLTIHTSKISCFMCGKIMRNRSDVIRNHILRAHLH